MHYARHVLLNFLLNRISIELITGKRLQTERILPRCIAWMITSWLMVRSFTPVDIRIALKTSKYMCKEFLRRKKLECSHNLDYSLQSITASAVS